MNVQDFNLWFNDAPFIVIAGDFDFGFWFNGAPVLEQDESGSGIVRRRAQIM